MYQPKDLSGKVALITGASRGIGKAIALHLGELGAEVIVNYSSSDEKAKEVVETIKTFGRKSYKIKFDVSDEDDVNNSIETIIKQSGSIDILVNNAGITRDNLLMRMKSSQWDDVMNTNLKEFFFAQSMYQNLCLSKEVGKL